MTKEPSLVIQKLDTDILRFWLDKKQAFIYNCITIVKKDTVLDMKERLRKIKQYLKILNSKRWYAEEAVENITACPCGYKKDNTPPAPEKFKPFKNNGEWGKGNDTHSWFHFALNAPGKDRYLRIHGGLDGWDATNPQFILYINGEMRQGMDTNHREFLLDEGVAADVYVYAYTGPAIPKCRFFAETVTLDSSVNKLYYDVRYPLEMLDYLDSECGEYAEIVKFLFDAVSMLRFDSADFSDSVLRAEKYLEDKFYGEYCREQYFKTVCIGHTHIDCAWLWTLEQTREKAQRSFATAIELMKRYPEYKFMASQALLYKYLKEGAPEIYEQVRERVKEKRWEVEGAMWVESDCNIPDGESLVRQVVYGKNYFKKEFGTDSRVLWLPDVFGYSAALPQILKKAGVDWFVTSKISWNDTDRMPYDTFLWRGIDGTGINSYFLTAQNYKGNGTTNHTVYEGQTGACMIKGTHERYGQKELTNEALLAFGYGDGGGGPTDDYLELLRRAEKGIPGSPQTREEFVGDYLAKLSKKIENNPKLPVWSGELYLEFHRGTYTTQANNKKNNRKNEFALREAELWSVLAKEECGLEYPAKKLHNAWEMLLTNQFHDIIPGSSVNEVYRQSDKDYAEIAAAAAEITNAAKKAIASQIDKSNGYVVFNPHGFEGGSAKFNVPVKKKGVSVYPVWDIPALGYYAVPKFVSSNNIKIDGNVVETNDLRVVFDECWLLSSVYDKKNGREMLPEGQLGNELRVYQDYPDAWEAWEWQSYERSDYTVLTDFSSCEIVEDGVRRGIRIERPFGKSRVAQTVWFTDNGTHIVFDTTVDWHEKHRMLKAAFPVDINTDKASFEIQFGTTERPTHFNTSWDRARFEACAHKFADVSEGNYGVSLVNDCKYGYDVHEGLLQLSLLRAPTYPDAEADMGVHSFTYAICPHAGSLNESDTIPFAYYLNQPMTMVKASADLARDAAISMGCNPKDVRCVYTKMPAGFAVERKSLSSSCDSLICQTVKLAENGSGTVLRFYESRNMRGRARITPGFDFKKATLCDLLEEPIRELPLNDDGSFDLDYRGFEIITVKLN